MDAAVHVADFALKGDKLHALQRRFAQTYPGSRLVQVHGQAQERQLDIVGFLHDKQLLPSLDMGSGAVGDDALLVWTYKENFTADGREATIKLRDEEDEDDAYEQYLYTSTAQVAASRKQPEGSLIAHLWTGTLHVEYDSHKLEVHSMVWHEHGGFVDRWRTRPCSSGIPPIRLPTPCRVSWYKTSTRERIRLSMESGYLTGGGNLRLICTRRSRHKPMTALYFHLV